MQQISREDLQEWGKERKDFLLLDVREAWEHEAYNIGGRLIPLGELIAASETISRQIPIVVYCEKGIRSIIAIQRLQGLGFENLYNLTGGMKAWRKSLEQPQP